MNTHIALLRGVNLGPHFKIRMAELREHLATAGLTNFKTYIQSGNIVFRSEHTREEAGKFVERVLREAYDYEVPVLVLSLAELERIVEGHPWRENGEIPVEQSYLTYLFEEPASDVMGGIDPERYPGEHFLKWGKVICFYAENGYGRAKLNNNYWEKKLKVTATTRNWRTTVKLLEIGNQK